VAAVGGAASGAMAGATMGASLAVQATVMGVTNAYVGTLTRASQGQQVSAGTVATDAAIGAAGPAVAKIAAPVVTNVVAKTFGRAILDVRSTAHVNRAMTEAGNLPAWGGKFVTTEVVPAGTRFNMVVSAVQLSNIQKGNPWFGGWATPDKIPSQAFARNRLAILPDFKADVSYVIEVETTAPQTVNRGIVGAMKTSSGEYAGGANQVEFVGERNLKFAGGSQSLPSGSP
jgi:hypothetical protein